MVAHLSSLEPQDEGAVQAIIHPRFEHTKRGSVTLVTIAGGSVTPFVFKPEGAELGGN